MGTIDDRPLGKMSASPRSDCGHRPGEVVVSPNGDKWSLYCTLCKKYLSKEELTRLLWGPPKT